VVSLASAGLLTTLLRCCVVIADGRQDDSRHRARLHR
jgi:hypothetical protein